MLIFSYIISAALEATLCYNLYQATGEMPLIYGLLLFSSLLSIPIECSAAGERMREERKVQVKIWTSTIFCPIGPALVFMWQCGLATCRLIPAR